MTQSPSRKTLPDLSLLVGKKMIGINMNIPTRQEAEIMISDAEQLNPGPWVSHSRYTAQAAQAIARQHPELDAEAAFILGFLHDIGRYFGVTGMRHSLDGYNFLMEKGYEVKLPSPSICKTL